MTDARGRDRGQGAVVADQERIEMRSVILEYEHALDHVASCHNGGCPDCVSVAKSALNLDNHEDFLAMAQEEVKDVPPAIELTFQNGLVHWNCTCKASSANKWYGSVDAAVYAARRHLKRRNCLPRS